MAGDVVSVRLHLPQVRVLGLVEDTVARLVVSVESTLRRLGCRDCGLRCHGVRDRRGDKVQDLEVSGRPVTLVWSRRRMRCGSCGSRLLEGRRAFEGALRARLARAVVSDAEVMALRAAVRRRGVGRHKTNALVQAFSDVAAERRRSQRCGVLLVDETSIHRRRRYVTAAAAPAQARRGLQRRPEGAKPPFEPDVFGARFALLRRGDTVTDTEAARPQTPFDAHPRLEAAPKAPQETPQPLHRRRPPERAQSAREVL